MYLHTVSSTVCTLFPHTQVRATEGLSKLVSDLKENMILNDFSTINETTSHRIAELERQRTVKDEELRLLYGQTQVGNGSAEQVQTRTQATV